MSYTVEYNGRGRWIVMNGEKFSADFHTQAQAEKFASDQRVFEIFRANCMDFAGNYDVSPGQAIKIAAIFRAQA